MNKFLFYGHIKTYMLNKQCIPT